MSDAHALEPSFNLWYEPWITVEGQQGELHAFGLEAVLLAAHEHLALYDPSPLVVVGLHRLLTAILQAVVDPQRPSDLQALLHAGCVPADKVRAFGQHYADRFDLFSATTPFLQSGDLPLQPDRKDKPKTVAYLFPEVPAGIAITHYRHGGEDAQVVCPACAAKGLAMIPAFATSGGAGIKPSINGVPPIYVLPGGDSLFESLVLSLICPAYQPKVAAAKDQPWWLRPALVPHSGEVLEVGYLQSLTFPARRVRLHPELLAEPCTRCGQTSRLGVRTMIFEMGESRPKEAPFWLDPFAAYRLPDGKSPKPPTPIRPTPGKALWREFAGLFMPQPQGGASHRAVRPAVLEQMATLDLDDTTPLFPFRCVGLRTDMKAKIFEWVDADFQVPLALLPDWDAGECINGALRFATECAQTLTDIFRHAFGGNSSKQERHRALKSSMEAQYWAALAEPFRRLVIRLGTQARSPDERKTERRAWADAVVREASTAFERASASLGDDAATLRQRVQGENLCQLRLGKKRKDYLEKGELAS